MVPGVDDKLRQQFVATVSYGFLGLVQGARESRIAVVPELRVCVGSLHTVWVKFHN